MWDSRARPPGLLSTNTSSSSATMAGSTLSLDSLSSPSPSPSPPPETAKPSERTTSGLNSDSELSELTEEEQETDKRHKSPRKSLRNGISRRGRHPSRRGGRRKTNSIVPAPMWGWAETKSSSNVVEEEEEEELGGPPRAMEEEEEDDDPLDDEEDELGPSKNSVEAEDDPTDEEDSPVVNGADHDELDDESFVSKGDGLIHSNGYIRRSTCRSSRSPAKSEDETGVRKKAAADDDDEIYIAADDNDEASDAETRPIHAESENETESEDEPAVENSVNIVADNAPSGPPVNPPPPTRTSALMEVDLDVIAPPPEDITPLASAAMALSILGSTNPIDLPSLSHTSPSASPSAASSRSPSPPPGSDAEDTPSHPKLRLHEEVPEVASRDPDASVTSAAMEVDVAEEPEAADEQGNDHEHDLDADEEDDLDVEVESDLQPAYRAEALDVLATIELKFALLRERVYVEKMEGLAWEEALVSDGESFLLCRVEFLHNYFHV